MVWFSGRSSLRATAQRRRRIFFETLERREVLTSVLYLDFGDSFPAGGLQMTADNLRQTFAATGLQGPDLVGNGSSADPIVAGDTLSFTNFQSLVDFDYTNDGAVNTTDYTTLRQDILSSVNRFYAPFDVTVQLAPALGNATSLAYRQNIISQLQLGSNTDGERDAWVFVSQVTYNANGTTTSVGLSSSLNGIAAANDLPGPNALVNDSDDSAIAFADAIIGSLGAGSNLNARRQADNRVAYTAAHEAGHTFGTWHTWNGVSQNVTAVNQGAAGSASFVLIGDVTPSLVVGNTVTAFDNTGTNLGTFTIRAGSTFNAGTRRTTLNVAEAVGAGLAGTTSLRFNYQTDQFLLERSDVIPGSAGNDNRTNFDAFTRFPLLGDYAVNFNGNVSSYRPYDLLARNGNLGLQAGGPAFVTGTGAVDRISITPINATTANVVVTAFRNKNFTGQIQQIAYSVNYANGILVDAGFEDDEIVVNASGNFAANISVRGMQGTDNLRVIGAAALNATYLPSGTTAARLTGSSLPNTLDENEDYRGTITVGNTSVQFSEFEPTSTVVVNTVNQLTVITPNSADDLTLDTLGVQTRVRGTSGGVTFVSLAATNTSQILIDSLTNDVGGADIVTINALSAAGLTNVVVNTGAGNDDFRVVPSAIAAITVNGGAPVVIPGDKLKVELAGVTNPQLNVTVPGQSGNFTFGNRQTVTYTSIEQLENFDFGDAPNSFGTTGPTAARHRLGTGLTLGASVDLETDGQPSANALGDDNAGTPDDENGVTLPAVLLAHFKASLIVNASAAGRLDAWIDYNGNGTFELAERIAGNLPVVAGNNNLVFTVPETAAAGIAYARFRLSSAGNLGPTGLAEDGEVEDYAIQIITVAPGTVGLFPDPLNPGGQFLVAGGTNSDDAILFELFHDNNSIRVWFNGNILAEFPAGVVTRVGAIGRAGDDTIIVDDELFQAAEFYGDADNDLLFGARGNDDLNGGTGDDQLYGLWGNDILLGGAGNDHLYGHVGNDLMAGGEGNDHLYGDRGNDLLDGNNGNDWLFGGDGNDNLRGGFGNDHLYGDAGSDLLLGEAGNDFLFGGSERDLLIGGAGQDELYGDSQEDILIGGTTAFDAQLIRLRLILAEWNSVRTFAQRVSNIRNAAGPILGGTGTQLVPALTVFDDGLVDRLFGGSDDSWFFAYPTDEKFDIKPGDANG